MARWSAQKRAEARARILEAARAEFEAEGFEGAKMRRIAAEAGLAVGTLFNYFPDKRALLYGALYEDLEGVKSGCVASMPGAEEGLEALLVHTAGYFFDYYAQRPALSRTLLKESLWAGGQDAEVFRAQVRQLGHALVGRMEAMQGLGLLDAQASPHVVGMAFFSHYYFVLMLLSEEGFDPARGRQLVGMMARQLVLGVGVKRDSV